MESEEYGWDAFGDDAEKMAVDFVRFFSKGPRGETLRRTHVLRFRDRPPSKDKNQWGRPVYRFAVDELNTDGSWSEDRELRVTSGRLAKVLKRHLPLPGKTLRIRPVGDGVAMEYAVEDVSGSPKLEDYL